jgi:hypothetical protein
MHRVSSRYQTKINWEDLENMGIGKGDHRGKVAGSRLRFPPFSDSEHLKD